MLLTFHPLRAAVLGEAIESLALPPGSRGLDAGCGAGQFSLMLARAVGPDGRVIGLDLSPKLLDKAVELARAAGLGQRVSFTTGDVRRLPFNEAEFDWAVSCDLVGYAPLEPVPLIREMARVVRPGGKVAILAWSSQQLLPGHPGLEARLGATTAGLAPFGEGVSPERHFTRGRSWFREAGLANVTARTFLGQVQAPLRPEERTALALLFDMRWAAGLDEVGPEDRALFERLSETDSPDFIGDRPDYHAFFTYTMFRGRVAQPQGRTSV